MIGPVLVGKSQICPIFSSILRLGLSPIKRTQRAATRGVLAVPGVLTVLDVFRGVSTFS